MKDIKGYEGLYTISANGIVYNSKNKERKPSKINGGYLSISLYNNNTSKSYLVHRLVAITFIPNPLNLPFVNHKNGIKTDNRVENLEWCTRQENMQHAINTGLLDYDNRNTKGIKNGNSKLSEANIVEIQTSNLTTKELSVKFKVSYQAIYLVKKNQRWNK